MTTNLTSTFAPTRLQKLLGRNYKWWYLFKFSSASTGTGLYGFLISQFSDIIQVLAIVYIWIINGSSKEIITYLIIGRIFKALSDCCMAEIIALEIVSGKVSNYLLLPSEFIFLQFIREIGRRFVYNLGRAGSLLISIFIFFSYIDFKFLNSNSLLFTLPLIVISFIGSFFMEFILGFSASFFNDKRNYSGLTRAYAGVIGVLSGVLIPLDKLPFYKELIQFLPTSWWLHHPMQIYLGKYSPLETLYVFLGGIAWCVVLYFLAKWVFRMGLKRNESVGL